MIDLEHFVQVLTDVQGYWNKSFSPFVVKAWYKHLSERMTTEEFVFAVERAITECQFMPTPAELVKLAKGNPELKAQDDWDKLIRAVSRNKPIMLAEMSDAGKEALRAIGGFYKLGLVSQKDLDWKKKEFLKSWQAVAVECDRSLSLSAIKQKQLSGSSRPCLN